MAKCVDCGVPIREGEHFCGACGTQQPEVVQASESVADLPSGDSDQETLENVVVEKPNKQTGELTKAAAAGSESEKQPDEAPVGEEKSAVSPHSLGGSSTGDFPPANPTVEHHKGTTG